MTKIRLYQDNYFIKNNNFILNKRNTYYLSKVLRSKVGNQIILFNGDGYNYQAKIVAIKHKNIEVTILSKVKNNTENLFNITLIQAIGKNDKMDFIVQKATELGVNTIIPLISQRTIVKSSIRDKNKVIKWQDIAISASEQCGRSIVPKIMDFIRFNELDLNDTDTFILDPLAKKSLLHFNKTKNINLIIGPEGGFDQNELNNNYKQLSLGKRILRTETAGIVCLANINLIWNT